MYVPETPEMDMIRDSRPGASSQARLHETNSTVFASSLLRRQP
jgi:hypothetical protein